MLNPQPSSGFGGISSWFKIPLWEGIIPELKPDDIRVSRPLPRAEFQAHEVSSETELRSNATICERSGFAEQLTGGCWEFEIPPAAQEQRIASISNVDPAPCLITLKPSPAQLEQWLRTDVVPLLIYPSGAIRSFSATIGVRLNTDGPASITLQTSDVLPLLDPDGPADDEAASLKLTLVLWRSSYGETAHAA